MSLPTPHDVTAKARVPARCRSLGSRSDTPTSSPRPATPPARGPRRPLPRLSQRLTNQPGEKQSGRHSVLISHSGPASAAVFGQPSGLITRPGSPPAAPSPRASRLGLGHPPRGRGGAVVCRSVLPEPLAVRGCFVPTRDARPTLQGSPAPRAHPFRSSWASRLWAASAELQRPKRGRRQPCAAQRGPDHASLAPRPPVQSAGGPGPRFSRTPWASSASLSARTGPCLLEAPERGRRHPCAHRQHPQGFACP